MCPLSSTHAAVWGPDSCVFRELYKTSLQPDTIWAQQVFFFSNFHLRSLPFFNLFHILTYYTYSLAPQAVAGAAILSLNAPLPLSSQSPPLAMVVPTPSLYVDRSGPWVHVGSLPFALFTVNRASSPNQSLAASLGLG